MTTPFGSLQVAVEPKAPENNTTTNHTTFELVEAAISEVSSLKAQILANLK